MLLPVPHLSATIDARGNVTIAGWKPAPRPRTDGFRKLRRAGKCCACGDPGHIASNRRCPRSKR
jgi:hypothetical protein